SLACFTAIECQRAGGGSVILTGNRGLVSRSIIDSQSSGATTSAHDSHRHESNIFDHTHKTHTELNTSGCARCIARRKLRSIATRICSSRRNNSPRSQSDRETRVDSRVAVSASSYGRGVEELCTLAVSGRIQSGTRIEVDLECCV